MNPHIVVLTGPLKGQTFDLSGGELTLGREPSNTACLDDPKVSRRHAAIRAEMETFNISDLDSRNGTFVNGVPIEQHHLKNGDQIEIGDSSFLFLLQETDAPPESAVVELDAETVVGPPLFQLRQEDSVYIGSARNRSAPALTERTANDFKALLRICTEVNATRSQNVLQETLLENIFEVVPGDSGAILLYDEGADYPSSTFTLSRNSRSGKAVEVSRNLVLKVLTERIALLTDRTRAVDHNAQQSMIRRDVHSVLVVPLFVFDRIIGVIYLEATNPAVRFDESHLQFMMGVAGTAGSALENVRQLEWLQSENRRLKADFNLAHTMVGESDRMKEIYRLVARVAPSDSTVLICGESGTGKELVARAIHTNSSRSEKPFIAINCAALTETLLESELFGHEKGAFTGAIAQKKGKLEIAEGGTVFLDEVGELAPAIQGKMLRVLQERQFERVGGTRAIKVNIRLVAATNRDLERAIPEGRFRQDLYYRLNVVSLTMPPLRERREDIPLLARYFAAQCSRKAGRPIQGISAEARRCLMHHDWPGNVRELENAIERAVVLGTTDTILPEDLPEAILEKPSLPGAQTADYHHGVREAKKQLILDAMNQARGNYTQAAKLLGLHANNLHRLIRDLDLKSSLKKDHDEAEGREVQG